MGFFDSLFRKGRHCENCGAEDANELRKLPDGSKVRVCNRCAAGMDRIFLNPLHDFEFGEFIDNLSLSSQRVAGIKWGASLEKIVELLPRGFDEVRWRDSKSPSLQTAVVRLGDTVAELSFTFDDNGGLRHLIISPEKAVLNAVRPLTERFGEPETSYPWMGETKVVWSHDQLTIDIDITSNNVVSCGVRPST